MDIEQIDISRLKLLQAGFERESQALRMLTLVVCPDTHLARRVIRGVLGCNHHLVPILTSGHPFTDPRFALPSLIVVGRVDEVAAVLVEVVQHFKCGLLVTFAQDVLPSLAKVHGTKT